ncbi:MAG: asparagine synthase (glutamine-hydrolyzing) [Candidatus Kapabacteria bacterium]|nr:asparagine synthase (glutamine-hydrolyzing) [Candidatus Kapabacteria bacterium]
MCGIAGFFGRGSSDTLRRMTDVIAHRGPDADGFYVDADAGVHLGHRRLSILDISGGAQPMADHTGLLVITFNGEIYNHRELRETLIGLGHHFTTADSDTETLLEAYKAWGADMLPRLNGMFAFCIYDVARKRCFMARDRFGKKPLFYTQQHETFAFASELTSLEQHECLTLERSRKALQKYFAYGYIPAPHSLYERVHKLPGGHYMTFDLAERRLDVRQWWRFEIDPYEHVPANAEEVWGEQLIELLTAAIKRRMIADVPLGFFLSGGIDSSALVALASTLIDGSKINTFSIGFTEESFDESAYSTLVAEKFGTNHTRKVLDLDTALDLLPNIIGLLDEPMGDSSLLPTYLLCRETRKHVTVALGGDGADELFCGYDTFRAISMAKAYKRFVPKPLHDAVLHMAQYIPVSHRNMSFDMKIKRALRGLSYDPHLWNVVWMGPLPPDDLRDLFSEKMDVHELYSEAIEAWDGCHSPNYYDKATELYVKTYLQDDILVKVDRASMMNSLEARSPFLDIDFVNFVRRLPIQFRIRRGERKFLLKKVLEKHLPHEILYRQKKGFGVPIGTWMADNRVDIKSLNGSPWGLNQSFIENRVRLHQSHVIDNSSFLWDVVLLSHGRNR